MEIISLGDNKITDINSLEKMNFKDLKELYLYSNNISDIKIMEKVKFPQFKLK